MVFGKLDSDLTEAEVHPELLPMNRHPSEKLIRNLRFVFGTGLSFNGFYAYSVGIGEISYPQNASGALAEMFFPNPFVFSPNVRPGTISELTSLDLGQLVGKVAKSSNSSNRYEVIAAFSNALRVDEMPDASIVAFQRDNFYEVIRYLYQDHFDKYARGIREEDRDDKNFPKGREVTTIIERLANLPEEANRLLESGFFDKQPNVEDRELLKNRRNQYILHLVSEALEEPDGRNTLLRIISTFAWQKFKSVEDVAGFYGNLTGIDRLDFSEFPASETLSMVAELSALESPDDILAKVVALPESVRKGLVRSTESWAAPPFATSKHRSVTYVDPYSKRKNSMTFSDCVESEIMAFFNGLLHTVTEAGIVLDTSKLPEGARIRKFYELRDGYFSKYESASSQETHDDFAAFVARMPGIKYASPKTQKEISKRTAEIWAGVGNLAKVLCYLSGCDDLVEHTTTQEGLNNVFTELGGHLSKAAGFKLRFNLDIRRDAAIDDFCGEIEGSVNGTKSFVLVAQAQHGELKALQKPKQTWLSKLPSSGAAFDELPPDLKHCVYSAMPLEEFSALAPALQRGVIMSSPLEDLADLTEWAIYCFSNTDPLLRNLALPMARRLLHADDYYTTRGFVTKLFSKIKESPDCLTKEEYKALSKEYRSFLESTLQEGDKYTPNIMTLYGYKRGWLADVYANVKGLRGEYSVLLGDPITTDDLVNIVRTCTGLSRLSLPPLPYDADLLKYTEVVSNLPRLEHLSFHAAYMEKENHMGVIDALGEMPSLLSFRHYREMQMGKEVAMTFVSKCFSKFANLKFLGGLTLVNEGVLREILPVLKGMGLSSKVKLSIPCDAGEDYGATRLSSIYREVVGHDIPEDC